MDKNAIKKFAVWARRELIARVSQRAALYEITEQGFGDPYAESVHEQLLTAAEKKERKALIEQIKVKGYMEVMEEVAYTWFNRFCALRFMEVNGYLPSHVRVFTDDDNAFKPQILAEAINLELDGLDMEKVYALKNDNETEELFKYLLIVQCNALNPILSGMFQKIEDYTELLFPDHLLRAGSVIEQMVAMIPEEDWQDAVQIIGWLYQYYNSEKKDDVFAALKKNVKITKENIPAATQLFTPDWIVRYMVENALGRLWVEGHPNEELKAGWKYYLEEAEQERSVQEQLAEIRKEYAALNPEEIKCIDPCCGSGHILTYMFDVLVQIYESQGYMTRDAVKSIVENNLFGLDIDERAAQLAYFSVMMKGRQYDSRFFKRGVQSHVFAIKESHTDHTIEWGYLGEQEAIGRKLYETFVDAKEYGSILTPDLSLEELDALEAKMTEADIMADYGSLSVQSAVCDLIVALQPLLEQARILVQKYHAVVTNPPYMGGSGMSGNLSKFVKKHYPDSKSDLFAVFMERCGQMLCHNGFQGMITQHAWMFLSSYEKLRTKLQTIDIVNMAHLGARAFEEIDGEVVQTTAFVLKQSHIEDFKGTYCRLIEPTTQKGKEELFLSGDNRYFAAQSNFSKIPGSPVAYWTSEKFIEAFSNGKTLEKLADVPKGLSTGCVDLFMRCWFEVEINKIDFSSSSCEEARNRKYKWFPYAKGGSYRRWNGNLEYVVNWYNNGYEVRNFVDEKGKQRSRPQNTQYYFKQGITYSAITSGTYSVRFLNKCIFGGGGDFICPINNDNVLFFLGFLNSKVAQHYLNVLSPTMNFEVGHIKNIPIILKNDIKINSFVNKNITFSKIDWDSFETSWDFKRHPLLAFRNQQHLVDKGSGKRLIAENYKRWKNECSERTNQLKTNEEELNRIFIDIYDLQDELTSEVADKDVTVRDADLQRDIKSFISYAVGCMFGRYSLDIEGLCFAGGEWDSSKYCTIIPDKDSILPICDDEYFEDDIAAKFINFVRIVYGEETLEENLQFIAEALGGKGQPREVIRNYFLNDFFKDHCKIYQKRPIYWLFDSGKKNGFKCLIYMHRYQPDTIARIRTDYVHEQQSRYRTAIADLENRIAAASTSERVKLNKQLKKLMDQAEETRIYEEKIHHLADQMTKIDLDDGVRYNYELFRDVLAKIK